MTWTKSTSVSFLCLLATIAVSATTRSRAADGQQSETAGVYVVGALHRLHESEEAFGFEDLRRIVVATKPHVMLLEVRPDELAERKETPGRPEYPQTVWPLLAAGSGATAIAMEPGGPVFAEMTGAASKTMSEFGSRDPEAAKRWSSYQKSLEAALRAHWRHPADAHDTVTADLSRGYYVMQNAVVGDAINAIQQKWDDFMVDRARDAIRAAPNKRVLVLCSYRNRHRFEDALRAETPGRLVDMEAWLRANFEAKAP